MADKLKSKIISITTRARGARTAGMFARELGEGNVTWEQIVQFEVGVAIPSPEQLQGVLRSPDTTPNGRDWARAILKEIEKAAAEYQDVERRL